MKLATIRRGTEEITAIWTAGGYVALDTVNASGGRNSSWPLNLGDLFKEDRFGELTQWYRSGGAAALEVMSKEPADSGYAPLYRNPRKIWGIGMNYTSGQEELARVQPDTEPVGFLKPDTSLIGFGDVIRLPAISGKPTAEAELAIVIGKTCRFITEEEAPDCVAGFTASLDMTAADIHEANPRFLTRAKGFDTFFSFGPSLLTPDEVEDPLQLQVETVLNGEIRHRNLIANMRYRPWFAVAFHSRYMTLLPGDIIMTGTPGAVLLRDGDIAECRISGFDPLANPAVKE